MEKVRRLFVEKKPGFDLEAQRLKNDLIQYLGITKIENLRIINRYDFSGLSDSEHEICKKTIFSEPNVDDIYEEELPICRLDKLIAFEYLPGQYDQRADSASECIKILTQSEKAKVISAKVIVLSGDISELDIVKIKQYCINPIDSREASFVKPEVLDSVSEIPSDVRILEGFTECSEEKLHEYVNVYGLAMTFKDIEFCRQYFSDIEKRDPSLTEIKLIDTYWSDHCRHTTFTTAIEEVAFEKSIYNEPIENAYSDYRSFREDVYGIRVKDKPICLMDMATIAMKEMKKRGLLNNLDESEEINACSINVDVDIDGNMEKWVVMFKNETHNHPTEIEPFGGAATCLGGAIRDPLSGRAYVYQAMRVTGSGDPRAKLEDTLKGKLPQRKITIGAAHGYSSYGNQIGLATGQVTEIYDPGYVAKRMEIGAVIAAAPKLNIVREAPVEGDIVILVGGRTGRDGCGGATGSSKAHTEQSLNSCGAEVQKGNPPTERKIQRLFRNPDTSTLIKRCNDFGAGGVAVAIGELADGLKINLDLVPKKYEGLDGTELAISESQERMAVVVAKENAERFINYASIENLEATIVAEVTSDKRLKMFWRGKEIVDISREFLNTNGVRGKTEIFIKAPEQKDNYFNKSSSEVNGQNLKALWLNKLKDLNICSQKGLAERFDSTVGACTVLMPFGGKYALTPAEGMAAKIPLVKGETNTGTIMTYGFNPKIGKWSPFHGAVYAIVEAVTKIVCMGGDYRQTWLTLQEYFERLGNEPARWGKPFSALLGAMFVQQSLGIAAIGGKDSMSGSFNDLDVPPTLVAFAVNPINVNKVISPEFKKTNSKVILIPLKRDIYDLPDFNNLKLNYKKVSELISNDIVLSACSIRHGGICEAISKMCFGNKLGINLNSNIEYESLLSSDYGSIILELQEDIDITTIMGDVEYKEIGKTISNPVINIKEIQISIDEALTAWESTLEEVFPTKFDSAQEKIENVRFTGDTRKNCIIKCAEPRVFIPIFPGTNCEYESKRAFEKAGGRVETLVFKNMSPNDIEESIEAMEKAIKNSQIIMLPGGFSAGDEPDGSGKFIATIFRNPRIREEITELLKNRDGLILGICNGFQALIKLGLLPYGEIQDISKDSPTLTFNKIGRHISAVVQTKVISKLSPWLSNTSLGEIYTIPISHGEGRFMASEHMIKELILKGQIGTQYVEFDGQPTYNSRFNPNGSFYAVEGISSADGRVFGKMGHSERIGDNIIKNIPGLKNQKLFEAGINYYK